MADIVEPTIDWLATVQMQSEALKKQAARIEQLETALREIAKHPRGGMIDTPEKMDRDEFIGIARAALEDK